MGFHGLEHIAASMVWTSNCYWSYLGMRSKKRDDLLIPLHRRRDCSSRLTFVENSNYILCGAFLVKVHAQSMEQRSSLLHASIPTFNFEFPFQAYSSTHKPSRRPSPSRTPSPIIKATTPSSDSSPPPAHTPQARTDSSDTRSRKPV